MWSKVGLVRNGAVLKEAIRELDEMEDRVRRCSVIGPPAYNLAWHEAMNVKNMVQVARMIAAAAYMRDESRGSHYRSDFPFTNNESWYRNITVRRHGDRPLFDSREVQFTHKQPEDILGGQARVKVEAS
jgi:succinate dehydrogenase / fumarate reductase flavoprotein subunit/fumarate reductase flavoprotein subunit